MDKIKEMDQIKIKDLEVYCHHGVYEEENVLGQKFMVSAGFYMDTKEAGKMDSLEKSVNYAQAAHFIKEYMSNHTFRLLEAAAHHLAEELLLTFPLIACVRLEIKKPWAPILLPLDTVSVEIERRWHTAYIALGSNMGDTRENLNEAVRLLGENQRTQVKKVSSFILTAPMGEVEQDDFLNGMVEVDTLLEPEELLDLTASIENQLKRVRTIHWGPRTLDLDIILYEHIYYHSERLTIPHIGMQYRDFVLRPLCEIAPEAEHPLLQKNAFQLLNELSKTADERKTIG